MKTEQPPAAGTTASKAPIVLSVDAIVQVGGFEGSRLVRAGEPTPFVSESDVPDNLKPFIADPSQAEEPEGRFGTYDLNVVYSMNPDGSRGRAIRRQVAELSNAQAEQEWAEQAAEAQRKLDPETEAILQEQHDARIAMETKILEIKYRDSDNAPEAIMRERDEEARQEQEARVTMPASVPEQEPASKPHRRK